MSYEGRMAHLRERDERLTARLSSGAQITIQRVNGRSMTVISGEEPGEGMGLLAQYYSQGRRLEQFYNTYVNKAPAVE